MMIKRFKEYVSKEGLLSKNSRVLVAVSGGLDSMVLTDLMIKAGYTLAIAHCNFRLRAKESGGDEDFVEAYAHQAGVPFMKRRFNTRAWAEKNGISIQMAARDLRYRWFNQLMRLHPYDCVVTAHHADDEIETFFINLVRGTGISGLQGIPSKMNNTVRPLLFASRSEIAEYAAENNIEWREDSSNKETKYLRNQIRNSILPLFVEASPGFRASMYANMHRIHQAVLVYRKEIETQRTQCVMHLSKSAIISIPKLNQLMPLETYLYEFLQPFGFSYDKTKEVFRSLNSQSGKQFFSPTHKLLKDRDYLLIERMESPKTKTKEWFIQQADVEINKPVAMLFSVIEHSGTFKKTDSEHIAHLDFEKLRFPLIIRKWKAGDYFFPLGMNNRKKLSNFFTDMKLDLNQKQNTWLLCSGNEVVWIAGYRIDNRFKITPSTRKIFKVTLKDKIDGLDKNP